jgi:hypothetical protein
VGSSAATLRNRLSLLSTGHRQSTLAQNYGKGNSFSGGTLSHPVAPDGGELLPLPSERRRSYGEGEV